MVLYYVFIIFVVGSIISSIAQFMVRGFVGNFTLSLKIRFVSAVTLFIASCSGLLLVLGNLLLMLSKWSDPTLEVIYTGSDLFVTLTNNTKVITDKTCVMITVLILISSFVNYYVKQTELAFFKDETTKRTFYTKARKFAKEYMTIEFGNFGPEIYCPICSCMIRDAAPHRFKCPNCGFDVSLDAFESDIQ